MPRLQIAFVSYIFGELAEWLKAHAWKVCLGLNLTRVRISRSPPNTKKPLNCGFFVFGVASPFLTHVYRYDYAKHAGDIVSGVVGMNM
jgi:hypothetical protein